VYFKSPPDHLYYLIQSKSYVNSCYTVFFKIDRMAKSVCVQDIRSFFPEYFLSMVGYRELTVINIVT
jgi:hypothetical protein